MNTNPDYNRLYDTAERQAGYFTAAQARKHGFSWERLSDNVKHGRFLRLYRGVYRLANFPSSPYEDLFVAWLRTGPHSVISHESALSLYNLSDVLPQEIHVIIPRSGSRRRPGLRLHTNQLRPEEITTRQGLPVTTVARTIADVAVYGLDQQHIIQSIQEGLYRGLTTPEELIMQADYQGGRVQTIIYDTLAGTLLS
ncbi:MAG: type IV toxin-antitoxin system AbiEi family antitoxin domain-containing protein [Chloroflexi bacterium]|nr:type IV toxin-antitoxin system AbiEi family antitoxin domain-containing protein [Chloroflexota bacterium]